MSQPYDAVIIGGGPAGSTVGTLMRKYGPEFSVLILEKEQFPRDHVGESQLPPIGAILEEMGCWDAVEQANFPIKVGATYRWGGTPELWDFDFLAVDGLQLPPRPALYAGVRAQTAFQVERARYDDILLRHAASVGCTVRQQTRVETVEHEGEQVTALVLAGGERVTSRFYIDASGGRGVLRSALGVPVECPTSLRNVAIWDYWENASWASEIGSGGTRVQVMSIEYGWLWFIPLGPTRTSIGLICPADHHQQWPGTREALYLDALARCPRVSHLIEGATRRGHVEITKDWSFLAERCSGDNWLLVGEAIGFADPILAAGMTLAHTSAREAAYILLALLRGQHEVAWLRRSFDRSQRGRIRQHIRFADFWYASNGQFVDLRAHCSDIAREAGLDLNSEEAWQWLARGGFTQDSVAQAGIAGLDVAAMKQIAQRFLRQPANWRLSQLNVLSLDVVGATCEPEPVFKDGTILAVPAYYRDNQRLVETGMFALVLEGLKRTNDVETLVRLMQASIAKQVPPAHVNIALHHALQALETLISEGWVTGYLDPNRPRIDLKTPDEGTIIHRNTDPLPGPHRDH